jgi:hypothetical protein
VETLRRELEEERQKLKQLETAKEELVVQHTRKQQQLISHMRTKAKQEADAAAALIREEYDKALTTSSSERQELQVLSFPLRMCFCQVVTSSGVLQRLLSEATARCHALAARQDSSAKKRLTVAHDDAVGSSADSGTAAPAAETARDSVPGTLPQSHRPRVADAEAAKIKKLETGESLDTSPREPKRPKVETVAKE